MICADVESEPESEVGACSVERALAEGSRIIGRVDARALLCHVIGRDTAYLIAHREAFLTSEEARAFRALLGRRQGGEPVAYLTGEREFFGRSFKVTPAVLVPRAETERLVELALERVPSDRACSVLDLGTGSGCIAITIAIERPLARVKAVDQSREALEVACENAARLGAANIRFARSDWFSALQGRTFDVILANPPYVAEGDPHLQQGDLRFEPAAALRSGPDGLAAIRRIVSEAPAHLEAGGWLLLEHGYDQAERARTLVEAAGFDSVFSAADLAGIARVTGGRLTPAAPSQYNSRQLYSGNG